MFDALDLPFSFASDNHSGVHPTILAALTSANRGHCHSYDEDPISQLAKKELNRLFGNDVQTFFVFNGTAANVLALRIFLDSFESALVSDVSHLYLDECAAPETMARVKLYPVRTSNGKIIIDDLKRWLVRGGDQHYSQPRLLSLTQPTELGTTYSLEELKALITIAKEHGLFVHIDGTRLIHASHRLNLSLYKLTFGLGVDAVSFGGTKNGLMFGEALLIRSKDHARRLHYLRKQFLQLASKTRFIGAQFLAFLKDDLWLSIAQHSCDMADLLENKLKEISKVQILYPVQSNAIFIKTPKDWIKPLKKNTFFYTWDELDLSLRLVMSFNVTSEHIDYFMKTVKQLEQNKHG